MTRSNVRDLFCLCYNSIPTYVLRVNIRSNWLRSSAARVSMTPQRKKGNSKTFEDIFWVFTQTWSWHFNVFYQESGHSAGIGEGWGGGWVGGWGGGQWWAHQPPSDWRAETLHRPLVSCWRLSAHHGHGDAAATEVFLWLRTLWSV